MDETYLNRGLDLRNCNLSRDPSSPTSLRGYWICVLHERMAMVISKLGNSDRLFRGLRSGERFGSKRVP